MLAAALRRTLSLDRLLTRAAPFGEPVGSNPDSEPRG